MKRNFTIYITLIIIIVTGTASVKETYNSGQPPSGQTGVSGSTCVSCHSDNPLNAAGGSVVATGLPSGTYVAGQTYNFTIQVNHAVADRGKWGFAIKAVNSTTSAAIGTFTTTNSNAGVASNELSHRNAPSSSGSTFTFTNLKWTAPATATAPASVKFYFVGNAADGGGGTGADFIYSNTTTVSLLPVEFSLFTVVKIAENKVAINWKTATETNTDHFEVEKSIDANNFKTVAKIAASGTATNKAYTATDVYDNANSVVYYRIKSVDKNGAAMYSKTQAISTKNITNYVNSVYPNPIKKGQDINVELVSDKEQTANFIIVNAQGKIVSAKEKNIIQGNNNVAIKLGNFIAVGNYYLQIKIGNTINKQFNIAVVE